MDPLKQFDPFDPMKQFDQHGITFHLDDTHNYTRCKTSQAFLKHFDMTFATSPLNLAKEFAIREQTCGTFMVGHFPNGLLNELSRHVDGKVKLTSLLFAQLLLAVQSKDLKEVKEIRLINYREDIPPLPNIVPFQGFYYVPSGIAELYIGLTSDGVRTTTLK